MKTIDSILEYFHNSTVINVRDLGLGMYEFALDNDAFITISPHGIIHRDGITTNCIFWEKGSLDVIRTGREVSRQLGLHISSVFEKLLDNGNLERLDDGSILAHHENGSTVHIKPDGFLVTYIDGEIVDTAEIGVQQTSILLQHAREPNNDEVRTNTKETN